MLYWSSSGNAILPSLHKQRGRTMLGEQSTALMACEQLSPLRSWQTSCLRARLRLGSSATSWAAQV